MDTVTRSFQIGYMEERRAIQRVCLCTGNLCNAAPAVKHSGASLIAVIAALVIIPQLLNIGCGDERR